MNNLGIAREILGVLGVYKLECEMCFIKALLLQNLSHMSMSIPDLNWKNNVYLQHYIGMETSEIKMNAVASLFLIQI